MAGLVKRNGTYYLQWYAGKKIRRRTLRTTVYQIAKEKLRQFESARFRGEDLPLPTRTPIAEVVTAYVDHIRSIKTPKSAQTDVYYPPQPAPHSLAGVWTTTPAEPHRGCTTRLAEGENVLAPSPSATPSRRSTCRTSTRASRPPSGAKSSLRPRCSSAT
jgi:hypothetical protein